MAEGGRIAVQLAWVDEATGTVRIEHVLVPAGCDVAGVIAAARAQSSTSDAPVGDWTAAVYGRLVEPAEIVRDGDRVELLGALRVDPKVARMRRVAHKRAAAPGGKWNRDR